MQRSAALDCQTPVMSNDITGVCASHNLSQNFQLSPGKLYCSLIKILEVGGLAIQKESLRNGTYSVHPVKETICRMNLCSDYYHHEEWKWSKLVFYFSNDVWNEDDMKMHVLSP